MRVSIGGVTLWVRCRVMFVVHVCVVSDADESRSPWRKDSAPGSRGGLRCGIPRWTRHIGDHFTSLPVSSSSTIVLISRRRGASSMISSPIDDAPSAAAWSPSLLFDINTSPETSPTCPPQSTGGAWRLSSVFRWRSRTSRRAPSPLLRTGPCCSTREQKFVTLLQIEAVFDFRPWLVYASH